MLMLVVLIKAVIVFFLVLFCVRLMGKRQLGEMQPFELVIMLIVADVACIPINDPFVPFYGGVIPIVALTFLHIMLSLISRKSIAARRLISGRAIIAIDKDGINYKNLKKMNLNMNDLIEALRGGTYMDINEIEYAIFETNGKICVIEKMADPTKPVPALLPVPLIMDGRWDRAGIKKAGTTAPMIEVFLKKNKIKNVKDILYMDVRQDGTAYVSPKDSTYFTGKLSIIGEW